VDFRFCECSNLYKLEQNWF